MSRCAVSTYFSVIPRVRSASPYSTSPVTHMGILSAVAGVVARAVGAVSRAIAAGASEDARLGRYLHYNINYRAARSPSLRFQCGHGFVLGAPLQISTPLVDSQSVKSKAADGGLSANESAAVVNAIKGIPLEAAFPVLRGGSPRGMSGSRSDSDKDDSEVCGMLYIRAIARQAESRGADAAVTAAAAAAKASASLLPKGKPHSAAAKLTAGSTGSKASSSSGDDKSAGQLVSAGGSSSDVAAASAAADLTGGLAALQPLKGAVAGIPLTLAVRSRRVLQAVAGKQAQFVEASEAAAAAAREARMEARMAARDAVAARVNGAGRPTRTEESDNGRVQIAQIAGSPAGTPERASSPSSVVVPADSGASSDSAALAVAVARDFAPILGSSGMFVAEQLQDTADEAHYRGLAPAVTFDVHEAVFVPSSSVSSARGSSSARSPSPSYAAAAAAAAGAPAVRLDLTRELRGIVFDDLGALADGAAAVILQRPDGVAGLPDAALLAAAATASTGAARAALAAPATAPAAATQPGAPCPASSAVPQDSSSSGAGGLPVADISSLPTFKP